MAKPYGIKILLGCEIRFAESCNDYLIYGVDQKVLEEAYDYVTVGMESYRNHVVLSNSLFIQAHPFRDNVIPANPKLIDGIETLNFHPGHNSRDSNSAAYAKENHISICTGGSDFHHDYPYHPASVLMLSKTLPNDSFELATLLKEQDYIFLLGDYHIIIP